MNTIISILATIGAVVVWSGIGLLSGFLLNKLIEDAFEDEITHYLLSMIAAPIMLPMLIIYLIGVFTYNIIRLFFIPKRLDKIEKQLKRLKKNNK